MTLTGVNTKMTSREIAELTGMTHANLMKAMRKMEEAWVKIGQVKFYQSSYTNSQNREMPEYQLSKTECLYIASKFNDEIRAKLILRWEELEKQNVAPINDDQMILQAVNILNQRVSAQTEQLKIQAPKVQYFNEVLQSNSTYNTNQIAKELGMSARSLNSILKDLKIQYKQNDTWLLYQKYQNKGFTKTKTHVYTNTEGETMTSMLTVWTESGRKFIHENINVKANC